MAGWNPWHGCHRISEGCRHCYVFRMDSHYGRISDAVHKNRDFDLPVRKNRDGSYKIPSGEEVYTCFTSDFFLEDADPWREAAWQMIAQRQDLHFFMITKRIHRFGQCIPPDWGKGYPNVTICCTIENQEQCDIRFPVLNKIPAKKKMICCEPLLTDIDMRKYLNKDILRIIAGGESGKNARICNFDWVLNIRSQCIEANIPFFFKQTGANFIKGGKLFAIPRKFQHIQAKKADIDFFP